MTETRRMARVRVAKELLVQALHLPADAEILTVRVADDPRDLEMVVRHPDLPPIDDSGVIPLASPQLQRRELPDEITFLGWGL